MREGGDEWGDRDGIEGGAMEAATIGFRPNARLSPGEGPLTDVRGSGTG